MENTYKARIGRLIQKSRQSRGMTQQQLADSLATSQSAINRIERGGQNISLEMLARISEVLSSDIVNLSKSGTINFRIYGKQKLSGKIAVKTSKNAAVGLLCGSLLNRGTTILRGVPKIEEVNRIIEVLSSMGVRIRWIGTDSSDLEIIPPTHLRIEDIDAKAARQTRSIIMLLGPLLHRYKKFNIPYAGGCNLGKRTVEPHLDGLRHFGLEVTAHDEYYQVTSNKTKPKRTVVLSERGDTVTENVLFAAAMTEDETIIRNASPNYMVQDICLFLKKLGVKVDGIGTTTLRVTGLRNINKNIEYHPSEDPIEAMSFITAAIVTRSEITIKRAPIEFLEIELDLLERMGFKYALGNEYKAKNDFTRLVDIKTEPSNLKAPLDKIHALPFPGINMDNLPFFAVIAACAKGRSLIHDWSFENRAIYFTELNKLNANVELLDPHRVYIEGPTEWKSAEIVTPPALRPAVVIMLAMLAAPGVSTLRNIYSIARGYEDFANRLNSIGAKIESFREI